MELSDTVSPLLIGCPSIFPIAVILNCIWVVQELQYDDVITLPGQV